MKPGVSWCHGSDKSCCARLADIVSWVWRKAYHQPYEPYRKLGIYESSALTMACWGTDVLLSSTWVGTTVTVRNKEKIVLRIESDTAISGQTEKSSDSNYGWLEITERRLFLFVITSRTGWLLQPLDFSISCALVAGQSSEQYEIYCPGCWIMWFGI